MHTHYKKECDFQLRIHQNSLSLFQYSAPSHGGLTHTLYVGRPPPGPDGGLHTALQTPKLDLGKGPGDREGRDINKRRDRKR